VSAVHSCPENLFARARAGSISELEQSQLELHLAGCEVCRAALFLSRGFDQRLPAQAGDTQVLARVLGRVRTARASGAGAELLAPRGPSSAPKRSLRARVVVLVAAAILTVGAATAAALPAARSVVGRLLSTFAAQTAPPEPARPVDGVTPKRAPVARTVAAEPATTEVVTPKESPVVAPPPAVASHTLKYTGTALRAKSRPEDAPTAEHLFAEANARRKAGDPAGAKRLYATLEARYPGSPEAQVASASLGRLLLERADDPAGALQQFDRLLSRRPGTMAQPALAEEALFGRATALMRMGRAADEKKTWLELLARFPGSVYGDRARERLRALK
jgi:TolA-binding protein